MTRLRDSEPDAVRNKMKVMKCLLPCSTASLCFATALVGCDLIGGSVAFGQSAVSLSGRAVGATGRPISHAVVRLVSDTTVQPSAHPLRYTLMGDSLGKFSQEGIAPGAYLVMLFTDGKAENILQSVSLRPGTDTVLEFRPRDLWSRCEWPLRPSCYRWPAKGHLWRKRGKTATDSVGTH